MFESLPLGKENFACDSSTFLRFLEGFLLREFHVRSERVTDFFQVSFQIHLSLLIAKQCICQYHGSDFQGAVDVPSAVVFIDSPTVAKYFGI